MYKQNDKLTFHGIIAEYIINCTHVFGEKELSGVTNLNQTLENYKLLKLFLIHLNFNILSMTLKIPKANFHFHFSQL